MINRLLILSLLLLTACDPASMLGFQCTDEGNFGLLVNVRDASTGDLLTGATLIARDGEYADTVFGGARLAAAFERDGTYQISVRRDGFSTWRADDVRVVRRGRCRNLQTVRLAAQMIPAT